ncbi:FAD/NAD(P)-binding protein [Granulicella sp. L60]|uniref:FAD/NAD(P)-binding protein n=1 Tax=Granulicella sp. L60 TaxID=1641866 RepID=UPI00131BE9F6|nr:FAD/NAD(P)-binding protein [Granulicella sp. L60]
MKTRDAATQTIAIVGGGVSGTLAAYHLLQHCVDARVIVIEPRPELGLGLAYSTPSLRHLLNVPAGKISAMPAKQDHFLNWLRAHYDTAADDMTFAPRAVFGRYIHSLVEDIGLEQICASVVDYRAVSAGAVLTLDDGQELQADLVVLATGNFAPAALPGVGEDAIKAGAYCHDAWADTTYANLDPEASIVLIGTGLTGVDVVLRLRELGHRGRITAISRHGVFPSRHALSTPIAESTIPQNTQPTCLAYLRAFRMAIRGGADWRAAIDSLRATTNDLWLALPLQEQQRFRRHLQRSWDIVRHRMAPPIADVIDAELWGGTLVIRKGHLSGVEAEDSGTVVSIRTAHTTERFGAARVINCTGPSMNYRRVDSPLLHRLFEQGLVSAGPLGGGFQCGHDGAIMDANGEVSERIYNLGPGRLGTLLESIAIPEIREQAVGLAETLRSRLNLTRNFQLGMQSQVAGNQLTKLPVQGSAA